MNPIHQIQGLADARKRARRSGLVQFFAVYQFDRGGILQMCHTVGELCNHAVRGSVVWRLTSELYVNLPSILYSDYMLYSDYCMIGFVRLYRTLID